MDDGEIMTDQIDPVERPSHAHYRFNMNPVPDDIPVSIWYAFMEFQCREATREMIKLAQEKGAIGIKTPKWAGGTPLPIDGFELPPMMIVLAEIDWGDND